MAAASLVFFRIPFELDALPEVGHKPLFTNMVALTTFYGNHLRALHSFAPVASALAISGFWSVGIYPYHGY